MSAARPLRFKWTGVAMAPLALASAQEQFEPGRVYELEVREPASQASRGHYFAALREGWMNLPEHLAERFPTPEHLRKYLLIRCGYRDERTIVGASNAQAQRIASFIRPLDEYAAVSVHEATVSVFTAKTQSNKAMGRKEFNASKQAVLNKLAHMIGVEREALDRNTGRAA